MFRGQDRYGGGGPRHHQQKNGGKRALSRESYRSNRTRSPVNQRGGPNVPRHRSRSRSPRSPPVQRRSPLRGIREQSPIPPRGRSPPRRLSPVPRGRSPLPRHSKSPTFNHFPDAELIDRNRNRSPPYQRSRSRSPRRYDNHQQQHHHGRTPESHVSSIFDRISSPPPRSHRSFDRNPPLKITRTFDEYEVVPERGIHDPQELILRDYRERLITAERHCHGLEQTVRSYEREIDKLRMIVNQLIDDFSTIQRSTVASRNMM